MPLTEKAAAEVQNLTWALADEMIAPDEVKRLETILLDDADARKLYIECMQLQADLHLFFNPKIPTLNLPLPNTTANISASTPVLTNLPTNAHGSNGSPTGV
jgi:hypothetical protein